MSRSRFLIAALAVGMLAACETVPESPVYDSRGNPVYDSRGNPVSAQQPALSFQPGYGVVQQVSVVDVAVPAEPRRGIGAGAVAGGVVGAILGSQIGSGTGRAAATVGGAVAGGYIGHQIERRGDGGTASMPAYELTLRMDNGVVQHIVQDNRNFQAGDRVQVTRDGRVVLM